MHRPDPVLSAEESAQLARVIQSVARSRRLSAADTEDFAQTVQLRLLVRRYDVFQRFAGRSSLRTYLTLIVTRMLLDWFDSMYGKWRPSAAAVRLGPHACMLDRLVSRDDHTVEEAIVIVAADPDAPAEAELRRIADCLPRRTKRRFVPCETLEQIAVETSDPIESAEHLRASRQLSYALRAALLKLPPDDRRLIELRYARGQTVQAVAKSLRVKPKTLYRRFDSAIQSLRTSMAGGEALRGRREQLLPRSPGTVVGSAGASDNANSRPV